MKKIWIIIFVCVSCTIHAQEYKASLIPDSLKENANAVTRYEELVLTIKSTRKAVLKTKKVVTILNENGDEFAYYDNEYSKFISLSDISGTLLDAEGKKIRSIKKKDIVDVSTSDDQTILTDTRQKRFAFYHKSYPYTVIFEDEQEYDGLFFLPRWIPVANENYAVQYSKFSVEIPADFGLRYKQNAWPNQPMIKEDGKQKVYTWEMKNFQPVTFEIFQPRIDEILPSVYIAPNEFEIAGFKGSMQTWKQFGQFINELNKGRNELPLVIQQEVKRIAEKHTTVQEKVQALFTYLQQNTRYISIQMGIGSWQPFDAKFVSEKKYGDCKALSNFMKSIFDVVGIPSNYVLIQAGQGRKGILEDFPSPYFNHATLFVPLQNDTIWLECTSQTVSPGYCGYHTGDRKALAITEQGGVVVSTPHYDAAQNLQYRFVEASIDEAGMLEAKVNTRFSGLQQETAHQLMYSLTQDQRDKYLNEVLNLPTYTVDSLKYTEEKGKIPTIQETMIVKSANYASSTGKRLFLIPNLFNRQKKLSSEKIRKQPVNLKIPFIDVDSICITIPKQYSVESMPKNVAINNQFGSYSISFKVVNNKIIVCRRVQQIAGTFPKQEYVTLVKYFDDMYASDHARIVFSKLIGI